MGEELAKLDLVSEFPFLFTCASHRALSSLPTPPFLTPSDNHHHLHHHLLALLLRLRVGSCAERVAQRRPALQIYSHRTRATVKGA